MVTPEHVKPWDIFECGVCEQDIDAKDIDWERHSDEYDGAPDAPRTRTLCRECSEKEKAP